MLYAICTVTPTFTSSSHHERHCHVPCTWSIAADIAVNQVCTLPHSTGLVSGLIPYSSESFMKKIGPLSHQNVQWEVIGFSHGHFHTHERLTHHRVWQILSAALMRDCLRSCTMELLRREYGITWERTELGEFWDLGQWCSLVNHYWWHTFIQQGQGTLAKTGHRTSIHPFSVLTWASVRSHSDSYPSYLV